MSSWLDCRQSVGLAASVVSDDTCRRVPEPRQKGKRQRETWLEVESGPETMSLSLDLKSKTHSQSWHIPYTVWQIYLITSPQHALCSLLSGKKKIGISCVCTKQYHSPSPTLELHVPVSAQRHHIQVGSVVLASCSAQHQSSAAQQSTDLACHELEPSPQAARLSHTLVKEVVQDTCSRDAQNKTKSSWIFRSGNLYK